MFGLLDRHQWDARRFRYVPHGHWDDVSNQKKFMQDLQSVTSGLPSTAISADLITKYRGRSLLHRSSVAKLVALLGTSSKPEPKHKSQRFLMAVVRSIVGQHMDIRWNFKHPDLLFENSCIPLIIILVTLTK
jgi:hypothetical protein